MDNHLNIKKYIETPYLDKMGFAKADDGVYYARLQNYEMSPVVIAVDVLSPAVGVIVSIRDERSEYASVLPIETEAQLNKLTNALQGK